jgi:non-specific serine/threonine protein kinase
MGVVYLAHDERLDRRVALKALPAQLVRDEAALVRLEQEARLLAAVNHPNVATIFGIEEAEGTRYLVLELVEGPTLAEQTACGALPMAQALSTCAQVAAGLAAAHERGVVHRDLKPANVKLTPKGAVKILDFGIASRMEADGIAGAASDGVSGTPGYMSPEQLRGEDVDQRCDAWAFGCLLFDCLAGAPAFPGDSLTDRIAATLQREPDWTRIPQDTPESVRALLARCLVKDVAGRLADLSEARIDLERAVAEIEAAAARPRGNLPTPASRFIGREREIEQVSQALRASRLVTLTGSGGCGKTRLAIAVAQLVRNEHRDGAWLVDLAPLADPRLVVHDVATALGVREQPGRALRETLVDSLKAKCLLLILDNCEHLLDACSALLSVLVPGCPELRVLATSREPLGLAGEQTIRVGSLALPEESATPAGVDALLRFDAVALLVERAQLANPDFVLSDADAADALAICRRLDGIPLAIELAAARLKVLSVAQVLERLKDRFKLLTGGSRAALPRHQTLRATLDWSHDHLSDAERVLYRRLAIFAGGCTLASAEAACVGDALEASDVLDLLTRLVDKSLLVVSDSQGAPRYRYLESVRQHAQEKLDEAGDGSTAITRHRDFFVAFAEEAQQGLRGADQHAWLARMDADHDNVRAVLDRCASDPAGADSGLRLAAACGMYWHWRGHWNEGRRRLDTALAHAEAGGRTAPRARALCAAGWLAWMQGDSEPARSLSEESISIAREVGDARCIAMALNSLGMIALRSGDLATARAVLGDSLAIWREIGDRRGIAGALNNLGGLALDARDLGTARALAQESLAIRRELGHASDIAASLSSLGVVAFDAGDLASARRFDEECLAIYRGTGDKSGVARSLKNLGVVARAGGDLGTARALFQESLAIRREIGDEYGIVMTLHDLGLAALAGCDLGAARPFLMEGLRRSREAAYMPRTVVILGSIGRLLAAEGEICRAVRVLGAGQALRESLSLRLSEDRERHDDVLKAARSALGEAAFAEASEAGAALTLDEAVDLALAPASV